MHILFAARHYFGNPDLVRLSTELAQRKHSVSVATSFRRVDRSMHKEGINVIEIKPLLTIDSIYYKLSAPFSRIYKFVQEKHVEVIHAITDYSTNAATAAFVSRTTNIPFVYTIQSLGTRTDHVVVDALAECYDWTVERLVAGTAKKVILLSRNLSSRAQELGVDKGKVVVIPSGVDPVQFDPDRPRVRRKAGMLHGELNIGDHIVVGYVGRLASSKGLTYLFSAISQIQNEHRKILLLIVGDGPERSRLEMMCRDLGIKVTFTGWQNNLPPYYAVMDVFVLPSLFEGLPNVVLEAMAMEKPVVATNVGGCADLIVDGKNGILVPSQDSQKLASALEMLIENDDIRTRMGDVNRQRVKQSFSWDTIVPKVEKVYDALYDVKK